jgi:2-iminobutanoate/2-iminopropanoate deaminase
MRRHVIRSPLAPEVPGASQAVSVEFQRLTFVSGQLPVDAGGRPVDPSIAAQTQQVLQNLGTVLGSGGLSFEALEQVTLYLVDLADLPAVDAIYQAKFGRPPPARSVVQVAGLPGGARVMIPAVAAA